MPCVHSTLSKSTEGRLGISWLGWVGSLWYSFALSIYIYVSIYIWINRGKRKGSKRCITAFEKKFTENVADELIQSEGQKVGVSSPLNTNPSCVDSLITVGKMSAFSPLHQEIFKRTMKILTCIHYFSE